MRNAPSVLIPVGRSRFGACALALAWGSGLALWVAWWTQVPDPAAWAGLSRAQRAMAGLLAVCGAWAWYSQRHAARGLLDWNGQTWCWTTAQGACEVRVAVACDLQRWLLVRLALVDGSGMQWLWLAPGSGTQQALAARRALYFQSASQAPPQQAGVLPNVPP
jgi:hypothetical protein